MFYRQQVINHRKTIALPCAVAIGGVIHTAQVDHLLEARSIAQAHKRIQHPGGLDHHGQLAQLFIHTGQPVAKQIRQAGTQRTQISSHNLP